MRYYDLKITEYKDTRTSDKIKTPPKGNTSSQQAATTGSPEEDTSSLHLYSYVKRASNGTGFVAGSSADQFDPGALDIQFNITQTNLTICDDGNSNASITIRGVDTHTIGQASNLVGQTVCLQAGMGKGLPLSNPDQVGMILHGTVLSAIGNWEDTELSLTLFASKYVIPPATQSDQGKPDTQKTDQKNTARKKPPTDRYQITCTKGNDLLTAIRSALQQANPDYKIIISIDGPIPCLEDMKGTFRSLKELCVGIHGIWKQQTQNQNKKDIFITIRDHEFHVINLDQPPPTAFVEIEFHELIGQPSWNGETEISFTCPLRGKIHVGDIITLKEHPQENTYGLIEKKKTGEIPLHVPKNRCLFSGNFRVKSISHTGNFRDKNGKSWSSTFTCEPDGSGNGASDKKSGTPKS